MILAWLLLLGGCEDDFSLGRNQGADSAMPPVDAASLPCYRAGCSGQLCAADPHIGSDCEWREEYACYRDATCERRASGACGWTDTPELAMCLAAGGPITPPVCYVAGCSGTACTEDPDISTSCEWREEYACYRSATCELQADGACGWTDTPELRECLETMSRP